MSGANAASPRPNDQQGADQRSHEPSMEEILASIRRIISDDQMLPLSPRANVPPLPPFAYRDRAATSDRSPPLGTAERVGPTLKDDRAPDSERPFAVRDASSPRIEPAQAAPAESAHRVDEEHVPLHSAPQHDVLDLPEQVGQTSGLRPVGVESGEMEAEPVLEHHVGGGEVPTQAYEAEATAQAPVAPPSAKSDGSGQSVTAHDPLISDHTKASVASSFHQLTATMLMQNFPPVEDIARELLRPMLKTWLDDNLPVVVERLVRAEIERVSRGVR